MQTEQLTLPSLGEETSVDNRLCGQPEGTKGWQAPGWQGGRRTEDGLSDLDKKWKWILLSHVILLNLRLHQN